MWPACPSSEASLSQKEITSSVSLGWMSALSSHFPLKDSGLPRESCNCLESSDRTDILSVDGKIYLFIQSP